MNITSILTTAAVIIAVTVPNVGAMQRADYPAAALRGDTTPPLDGPRDVERNHIIPPEHGGTGTCLAGEVIADQLVGSLGRGEQGRHVRGGSSPAPLVGIIDDDRGQHQQSGLVSVANYVSDETRRDLHHIETVHGLPGNQKVSDPINTHPLVTSYLCFIDLTLHGALCQLFNRRLICWCSKSVLINLKVNVSFLSRMRSLTTWN